MILQIDKRIRNAWIKAEGCATFCVFFIANKLKNYPFSIEEIERIVADFVKKDIYTKDMLIKWQEAFAYFGIKTTYKKESPHYIAKKNEYEITAYYNAKTKFTHFVITHGDVVIYDPLGMSVTVKDGYQHSKRIIGIIE